MERFLRALILMSLFTTFLGSINFSVNGQAPAQPTVISPIHTTTDYSDNTITVTVTDPNGDPMTVKLYGRKKNCTSTAPNFTIIGLPDTQFYTEELPGTNSSGGGHNGIFQAQTQWIANHRIDSNIAFVTHLGDCVQNGDNPPGGDKQIEWKRVDTAMRNLESPNVPLPDGIPYGMCVGNHDDAIKNNPASATLYYNQYFGATRFSGRAYYGGRYRTNNDNHYELFSSGGIDFIHISIEFYPDAGPTSLLTLQPILNWADSLLKVFPNRKAILSTHNLLGIGNPANFQGPGQKIYDDLKDNSNLFLMLAGHVSGEGRRSDTYNGNTVYSFMSDYQNGFTNGGNGFLRIMQIRPSANLMTVKTFSPYSNVSRTGSSSAFTIPVDFLCPFSLIATNTGVTSGTSTTFTWPGLQLSTEYEWYVTVDDGNGNITTSTINEFTTWDGVPIITSGSLRFTDSTYISLGTAAALQLTNFTLEAWVKIEGYGSTSETGSGALTKVVPIITKGRADGDGNPLKDVNYFLGYESGTNKLMADFEDNAGGGANHPVTSTATIPMNTWTHVGASFDVATRKWRLFIGATTEITTLASTYTPQSGNTVSACIGSSLANNTTSSKPGSFNGRIDEVRIWNKALTSLSAAELTSGVGLVGRWGMADGSGTTVSNSISGGADGTIVNNYEWVTGYNEADPTTNASIDFNGTHDYVTFGEAPGLNTAAFTVEGWIRKEGSGVTTTSGTGGVIGVPIITKGRSNGDTPPEKNVNYFLGLGTSNKLVGDFEEASGANHPVTGNAVIPTNVWTHVAATYEPVTAVWNLYINGVLDATSDIGSNISPVTISKEHAAIGSALDSTGVADGFFDGKIDEVRIWNVALTQAQIQANINSQLTSGTGLIGRWGFNQNGDSTLVNSIGGGVNGIIRSTNPYTHPTLGAAAWVSSGFIPTVTAATTTITTATPNSIEYGTDTIILSATVTANPGGGKVQFYVDGVAVEGPVTVAPATGIAKLTTYNPSLLDAGSHIIRGDFLGNGGFAANTGANITLTITPAPLTYVAAGVSRTYGAANPTLSGTVIGFKNNETIATATTGTLSFSSAAVATSNIGFYPITGSGLTAISSNYSFVQAAGNSTSLIITDAVLTYTAVPATRIYGDADPVFTGTITGFVNGETQATATTGTLTFTTVATATSNVGIYLIDGLGLTANNGNYTFAQAASNSTALTITKRPLDFSGARFFINGNSTFTAAQLTPGNIVNGDLLSISGSATVTSAALGTYTSFVSNAITTTNANYQATGGIINVSILSVPATNHKSLRFTDTTYIDLGNAPSLHISDFTIEAWIKIEGHASTTKSGSTGGQDGLVPIITKGRSEVGGAIPTDVNYFLGYRESDKKLVVDFEDNATRLNHSVSSATVLPMNTWVHVGTSFDVAAQKWRLFIDNTIEEFVLTGGPFHPQTLSDVPACIGSSLNTGTSSKPGSFNGRIDEVRIWNTALTSLNQGEILTSPANLVGRWSLDEGVGAVVANTVLTGPSGTIINNSEWVSGFNVVDSTTDASLRFNGAHDYVSFGVAPALGAATYTLEGWINIAGAGTVLPTTGSGGLVNVYPIISKGRNESDGDIKDMNYFLGISDTYKLVTDFEEATSSTVPGLNHPLTGTTTLPLNQWQHIAVTYDGSYLRLYLNGLLEATSTYIGRTPQFSSIQHAAVGSALNSLGVASGFFNGKIDEVKIWNRALSVSEIQPTSTSNCSPPSTTNLLGYWNFNENGNITAYNSVVGGVNGDVISTNISVHPTRGAASWACNGSAGNYFRSKPVTGLWSAVSNWEVLNGTTWSTSTRVPGYTDNVTISTGSTISFSSDVFCNDLTVNSGGKLYTNNMPTGNIYVVVYGHIICNGIIGNGTTFDGISFAIESDTCSITGTGSFDCSRIRKSCNRNTTTKLTFNRNVNMRYGGAALYNDAANTYFIIKIAQGVTVNCTGDGTANSAGIVAIDGNNGANVSEMAGSITVDGTLNITGTGTAIPTLYLTTNNSTAAWPVSVVIDSTGTIKTGIITCTASGTAGHSFSIMSGGKLNITGQPASYIAPSVTNNSYTLKSGSTIEYSKPGAQTVYTFGSVNYSNLFGSGSGIKSILAALGVTDTIKLTGTAVLASGGNLTLLSSATKTAKVAELPVNGSGVALATVTGDVTVERYISAKRAWRYLSIATNTTQTVRSAWQENMPQGSTTQTTPPGYGMQVTNDNSTWAADGFDYYSPGGPSVKSFNPLTNTYVGILNTSVPISSKTGWMAFVRGDRSSSGAGATPTPTILRTKGPLYTGTQSPFIVGAGQFTGIANPYAAPIDMRSIFKSGIPDFFYLWDPNLTGQQGLGAFQTFSVGSGGNYYPTPGGGSYPASGSFYNYIQSGQAFFVEGGASPGSVTLMESSKGTPSPAAAPLVFRPATGNLVASELRTNLYAIDANNRATLVDGTLSQFGDNYKNSVDEFDAKKMTNDAENLSVKTDSNLLVIERRLSIDEQDTIQLNMLKMRIRSYKFEFIGQGFDPWLMAFLEDSYDSSRTLLNLNGISTYNFTIANIPALYYPRRFRIVFSAVAAGPLPITFTTVKAYRRNKDIAVGWLIENELNIEKYEVEKSADGLHFTTVATVIAKSNNGGSISYEWIDGNAFTGNNFFRIKSIDKTGQVQYSSIAKLVIGQADSKISVYPNPVTGNSFNLELVNQPQGKYAIRLINKIGQMIIFETFDHLGGSITRTIKINQALAHESYDLEITNPDKNKVTIKLIF